MFGTRKHMTKPTPSGVISTTILLSLNSYTSNSITISWVYTQGTNGQVQGTFNFLVFKRVNGGAWTQVASQTTTNYYDTSGISAGNTYDYYITGSSATSNTISVAIPVEGPATSVPDAPSNFYASSSTAQIQTIYLQWSLPGAPGSGTSNGNSPLLEGELQTSSNGTSWALASFVLTATQTSFTAGGVTPGDMYYRVRFRNAVGWGAWSTTAVGKSWGYDVQTFTASGTWNKPAGKTVAHANVLVVAGGGYGGAGHGGGGGGGGQVVYKIGHVPSGASIAVTVGSAGQGSSFDGLSAAAGGNGGGVVGADPYEPSRTGSSGGSGGGGSRYDYGYGSPYGPGGQGSAYSSGGLTIYGNNGAAGDDITYAQTPDWSWGGGGGGAGSAGSGSNGGAGVTLLGAFCGQGGNGGLWSPTSAGTDTAGAAGGGYGAGGGGGGGGTPTGGIVIVGSYY